MPRPLVPCPSCAELVREGSCVCPHCGTHHPCKSRALARAALLLGIGLAGCDGGTTTTDDTEMVQADYSGAVTADHDEDGYTDGVDCNDDDPNIHPDATETPGDGVDSNCNNDDDT